MCLLMYIVLVAYSIKYGCDICVMGYEHQGSDDCMIGDKLFFIVLYILIIMTLCFLIYSYIEYIKIVKEIDKTIEEADKVIEDETDI